MARTVRIESPVLSFHGYAEFDRMDPFNENAVRLIMDQPYDFHIQRGDETVTLSLCNIAVSFMTGCIFKGDDQTDLFYVHPDDLPVLRSMSTK